MVVVLMQLDSKDLEVKQRRLSVPLSEEQIEILEKIAESEKRSMGAQAALIIESWILQYQANPTKGKKS
ncbi:hypothetical protein HCU40_19460 (plasmid) [Pseudanabaena biceps]|jgi:hypothetical protein|nr:hypothetical protein [Pseudanabaena biceps]